MEEGGEEAGWGIGAAGGGGVTDLTIKGVRGTLLLLLLLALVAEPHTHLFWEQVKLLGDGLNELTVGPRVLLEEVLHAGTCVGSEDSTLLALSVSHHRIGTRRVGTRLHTHRVFRVLEPFLQHLLDGSGVGRTQLHLFKSADGALSKVVVAFISKGLADSTLCEAKPDPPGLEFLRKGLQLRVMGCHLS